MSWVAELNATMTAATVTHSNPSCGLPKAIATKPATMPSCANNNQLRRRPNQRFNNGMGNRSTNGAHTHLKPYAKPTQVKKPTVLRSIPASRKRKLNVPSTNNKGNPAEKPNASIRKLAGSKYTLKVASQLVRAGSVLSAIRYHLRRDCFGAHAQKCFLDHVQE